MTSTTASTHNLILLGATGATGQQVLIHALSSPNIAKVYSFGRRQPSLPAEDSVQLASKDKLIHQSLDFDKLLLEDRSNPEYVQEAKKLKEVEADTVLITLGTTKKTAGSAEAFERIDREYVVKAAEAARIEGKQQKLIYLSSASANSSAMLLYVKSKGLTEEALAGLGYSQTYIFRPGFLDVPGGRGESRILETAFGKVMNALSGFSDSLKIDTPLLGKSLVNAAIATGTLSKFVHSEQLKGHTAFSVTNAKAMKLGKATDVELNEV